MLRNRKIGVVALTLLTLASNAAFASTWEELYSEKESNAEARVELDRYSLRERLVYGDKEISVRIRFFSRENETTTQAMSDYEIHCADREVFRSNLEMTVSEANRTISTVKHAGKIALEGQEYIDFVGVMEALCANKK